LINQSVLIPQPTEQNLTCHSV